MKRTYQPSKTRRARTHGFLVRMSTPNGRAIINRRRRKGRKRLAPQKLPVQSLKKRTRILKSEEYLVCYAKGARYYTPHFRLHILCSVGTSSRYGLAVSKKIANAVGRNRIKRLLREFFRTRIEKIQSCQIVVTARQNANQLSLAEVEKELLPLLKRSCFFHDE